MATIKSFTDLSQSKTLSKILPLESADMYWQSNLDNSDRTYLLDLGIEEHFEIDINIEHYDIGEFNIPAWSFAALLGVLPEYNLQRTDWGNKTEYKIVVTLNEDNYASKNYDNPLDACVDMIIKLHELKML